MTDEKPKHRRGRPRGGSGEQRTVIDGELSPKQIAAARDKTPEGEFPPAFIAGLPNPDHYRAKFKKLNDLYLESLKEGRPLSNHKQAMDGFIAEAEYAGVDRRVLVDARSDTDKVADLVRDLLANTRSIMEVSEAEIEACERQMDAADEGVHEYLKNRPEGDRARWAELGKRWGEMWRRLRALRKRATTQIPNPTNYQVHDKHEKDLSQAIAYPLRFMVYVLRSNLSHLQEKGGASSVLSVERHHCAMAVAVYCARNRCEIHQFKILPDWNYRGTLIVIPPGHGKTSFALAVVGQALAENPHLKVLTGHAVDDKAIQNVEYLKAMFVPDNPTGRRFSTLFPKVRAIKKDHSKGTMRLLTHERSRQPSVEAHGMGSAIQSSDADLIWFDDPVAEKERDQEADRKRKYTTMMTGWMSRLRSEKAWHLTTTTLWHHDDANSRRIREAREGKAPVKVVIERCGGPNTFPPFKALSQTLCPASMLKKIYSENEAMYATVYMCNPAPEESKIIRQLRLYDPETDEHQAFLRSAVFHLSLDPSATAREGSDKAGIVYGAIGEVSGTVYRDGSPSEIRTERRLRILWATAIHATQHDLVTKMAEFARDHRVDAVHVEVVSGYYGTSEMFRNAWGIQPIEHKPGNRSKEIRLRGVASLMEDSFRFSSGSGACIEFPGTVKVVDGKPKLMPDPQYEWLYRQFLEFGAVSDDHCLDATTQLAAHLQRSGDLAPGQGFITNQIRGVLATGGASTRMAKLWSEFSGKQARRDVNDEDAEFANTGRHSWSDGSFLSLVS